MSSAAPVGTALKTYDEKQPSWVLIFSRASSFLLIACSATFRFLTKSHRSHLRWTHRTTKYWRLCGVIEGRFHCGELLYPTIHGEYNFPSFIFFSKPGILENFAVMYTCFILCFFIFSLMSIFHGVQKDLVCVDFMDRKMVTSMKILLHTDSFNFCLPKRMHRGYVRMVKRDFQHFIDALIRTVCGHDFMHKILIRRNELMAATIE